MEDEEKKDIYCVHTHGKTIYHLIPNFGREDFESLIEKVIVSELSENIQVPSDN